MSVHAILAKLAKVADRYPEDADGALKIMSHSEGAGTEALTLAECREARALLRPPPEPPGLTDEERALVERLREADDGAEIDLTCGASPATALEKRGLVEIAELRGFRIGTGVARLTEAGLSMLENLPAPPRP